MATRFGLEASGTPSISPTPSGGWEDTTSLVRLDMHPAASLAGTAMASKVKAGIDSVSLTFDNCVLQFISPALAAGQTVTGGQTIKAQIRCLEADSTQNFVLAMAVYVVDAAGTTVQKNMKVVTTMATEFDPTTLTNRTWTTTSAATDYTTVAGDRVVVEVGFRQTASHKTGNATFRVGTSAGADLAEDETSTTDNRPWFELADTLTFAGANTTLTAAQGSFALTGQTVGLSVGHTLAAAQGSYALTGQDVTFTHTPGTPAGTVPGRSLRPLRPGFPHRPAAWF